MSDHPPLYPPAPSKTEKTGAGEPRPTQALPQPFSKKAAKRAAKEQRYAATKLERRARERETRKEKKRLKAEKRAAGELEDDEEQNRKQKKRKIEFGGRVVVDLGFDSLMNPKEIKSLCSQLAFTYSVNKHALFPFNLIFSSLDGRTFDRLENLGDMSYKRWIKTDWWHEGLEQLWLAQPAAPSPSDDTSDEPHIAGQGPPGMGATTIPEDPQSPASDHVRHKVVYLTADSEEELAELNPEETYVIGGICDHNRYKNLCLNKAKELGVRTAKLPIGRYLASMPTRKVLTVNQCFEILVKWVETKDWEEALYAVIPQRKFTPGGARANQNLVAGGFTVVGVLDEKYLDSEEGGDSPGVAESCDMGRRGSDNERNG